MRSTASQSYAAQHTARAARALRRWRLPLLGRSPPAVRWRTMVFTLISVPTWILVRWNAQKSAQVPVAKKLSHFRHRPDVLGIEAVALRSHVHSHRRGSE